MKVLWKILILIWPGLLGGLVRGECRPCVIARQDLSPTSICTRWAQQSILPLWDLIDVFRCSCRIVIIHLRRAVDDDGLANFEYMEYSLKSVLANV